MPAKTSVLLYLVDIVICARNFKHGRMDNNSRNQVNKNQKRVLSDGAGYRWQKRVGPEKAGPPREGGEGGGGGGGTR